MDRYLLLFLTTVSVGALADRAPCSNPVWQTLVGKNSIGGSQVSNLLSRAACLNNCAQNPTCIAADVDQTGFPPGCWLHFNQADLQQANIYDQPTTNQYRFIGCSNVSTTATCGDSTWEIYPDQLSTGASQYVGPRTIQQCLDYCSNNTACLAVDIDVNKQPLGCWPHFNGNDLIADNVYPQAGTNQYRLINRCAVKTTSVCYNPEWSVLVGQSSLGAVQYVGPRSVQECLNYCGQTAVGCVAADVDLTTTPPACWLHMSASDLLDGNMYSQAGVNQYRLVNKCVSSPITVPQTTTTTTTTVTTTQGSICPNGKWKIFRNQISIGADQYVGPRTIQQCLDYCNLNTGCIAVDVDVNVVPLGCWPHFNVVDLTPDYVYDQGGSNQYQLVARCTNPTTEPGCYNPDWSVLYNQSSVGAVQQVGPTSVQECLDYCGQTATGCVAVDVDLTKSPPTCWPHLSSNDLKPENSFPQIGVNQYRLITKCATYPIGATTTTPSPTTTQSPTCPGGKWRVIPDQIAVGADQYAGPRTIEQCLAYCNNRSDCVAVDIDVNKVPLGCWPHFSASALSPDNIYPQDGTNQYVLVERCRNQTVASRCYNPDWTVLEGQSSVGAVQRVGPTSVQQCLDYCGQTATGCIAVDVDLTQKPLSCWLHFNGSDLNTLYPQDGVNQYRLVTPCANYPVGVSPTVSSTTTSTATTTLAPVCPHGRWQQFRYQIANGGTQYFGPRTIAQCLDYCNNRTDCVAVDVNVNSVPVGCWPHFSTEDLYPDNIYNQLGTVQFRLVARCNTPPTVTQCYNPEWTVLVNQSSTGAKQYLGPTSVQECLDYCGQTAVGCVAVDVDLKTDPPTCWPHFDIASLEPVNMYPQPLVNQYRLVDKCASSPITTLAPIANLPVTMSPSYGPQAGGTPVNISCQTFNMLTIAYVVFNNNPVNVQTSASNFVVVLSPPSTMVAHSTITLVTTDGRRTVIDSLFEYKANPVFTDIKPLNHLIDGGTLVTVTGTNLDSVAHPMIQLFVSTYYSPQQAPFVTSMIELCHKPKDKSLIGTQMICQMPAAVIPPDFQSKLELEDGVVSGHVNGSHGGVASASVDDGRTVIVNVGLMLDGVMTYENISSTNPDILMDFYVQPTIFCSQDVNGIAFSPKITPTAKITGSGLLRGSQAADYSVTVGDSSCDNVNASDTILTFDPPAVQPQRTSRDDGCRNGGVTLGITVGFASYRCCIVYTPASAPNIGLIVGLTLGLVIPFIIIIFIVVVCCCCCGRRCCCGQDDEKTEKGSGSIDNPNYDHSTLSATPSTSSSTAPIGGSPPSPGQNEAYNFYWAPEKPGGTARVIQAYSEEKETENE